MFSALILCMIYFSNVQSFSDVAIDITLLHMTTSLVLYSMFYFRKLKIKWFDFTYKIPGIHNFISQKIELMLKY